MYVGVAKLWPAYEHESAPKHDLHRRLGHAPPHKYVGLKKLPRLVGDVQVPESHAHGGLTWALPFLFRATTIKPDGAVLPRSAEVSARGRRTSRWLNRRNGKSTGTG